MSILVVLTIIMLCMAASYATMHSQTTMIALSENGRSRDTARQTAQAAMSIALRRMHVANEWAGADTSFSGTLGTDRYAVQYYTGVTDATGAAILPDAADPVATAEWPFCVTVVATGYSSSAGNGTNESMHRLRSVVRLSKPALQSTPNNWALLPYFSLIQWGSSDAEMQLPARVEGWTYWQGGFDLASSYPLDTDLKAFDGRIDEVAVYDKAISGLTLTTMNLLSGLGLQTSQYSGQDPIAWWRLNESAGATAAADFVGNNHGTYEGAAAGAAAASLHSGNRAAQFDGYNDVVNLGRLNVSGSAMTILAWIRADSWDTEDGRIISKAIGPDESDHYWMLSTIRSGGSMRLRFRLRAGGTTSTLTASSGNLSTNTWTFVAATYDGSRMRLYKDGVEVGSMAKTGSIATNSDAWVFLGGNPPGCPRTRYLKDLRAMQLANAGNVHPLPHSMFLPRSRTSEEMLSLLDDDLQVQTVDLPTANASSFVTHPGNVSSYRLYPGGKSYSIPTLPSSLVSTSREPDVQTNPLGVFVRNGSVVLYDDVSVQGTLITAGGGSNNDLEISGRNVTFSPVNVPSLDGSDSTFQLPVAITNDDFKVLNAASVNTEGVIVVGDDFRVEEGNDSVVFNLLGKLVTKEFYVQERYQWDNKGSTWWRERLREFLAQTLTPGATNYSPYFPQWLMNTQALDPVPKIKISADPTNPTYHWHVFSQPLYTYDSSTATGMNWEIIAWDDGV